MSDALIKTADDVLAFWFSDRARSLWFAREAAFDGEIRRTFAATYQAAAAGRLHAWEGSPPGALALVIVLDQFALNMFRGDARGFATEAEARRIAAQAIARGFDAALSDEQKGFLYMPFMHSEDLADQQRAVELYQRAGLQDNLHYARHHRALIRRFGRFPHRNAILGRQSTPEEQDYLAQPDAFRG